MHCSFPYWRAWWRICCFLFFFLFYPSQDKEGFLLPLLSRAKDRCWVMTNLRPVNFDSTPVQDVNADMASPIRLVCGDRHDVNFHVLILPQQCFFSLLSRVRHTSTRSILSGCPSHLKSCRGCLCPIKGS